MTREIGSRKLQKCFRDMTIFLTRLLFVVHFEKELIIEKKNTREAIMIIFCTFLRTHLITLKFLLIKTTIAILKKRLQGAKLKKKDLRNFFTMSKFFVFDFFS